MAEFISWKSYFDFAGEVGYARRYVWSRSTHAFLDAIRDTAPEQVFEVDATDGFWRAVNAVSQPQDIAEAVLGWIRPCPPDRIKPLRLRAHEGRVNPKGIPCLYTATDPTTAISETRPALGDHLTLARLRPTRQLRLIDCSKKEAPQYQKEPSQAEKRDAVWAHMNLAFSKPVSRSDDTAGYAPTQLLAEIFKDMGYDGITYRSAFGEDGFNIAFFKPDDLHIDGTWVYRVNDISHKVDVVLQPGQ